MGCDVNGVPCSVVVFVTVTIAKCKESRVGDNGCIWLLVFELFVPELGFPFMLL